MRRFAEPFTVSGLRLRNRLAMSPMTNSRANEDGSPSEWSFAHYRARARGGTGLVMTEAAHISGQGQGFPRQLGAHRDDHIPKLRPLVEAVHAEGAAFACQLYHGGRTTSSGLTGEPIVAPSPIPHPGSEEVPRELATEEVGAIAREFGGAARRAKEAGFDAVEVHGGTRYLLQQFLSPTTNRRRDRYGGSLGKRICFPREVVRAIRDGVGPDYPVLYRHVAMETFEGGYGVEDSIALLLALRDEGLSLIHLSRNCQVQTPMPPERYLPAALAIREATGLPVMANGWVTSPEKAEAYLEAGLDAVSVARGMLADPEFARKAVEGRWGEIIECVHCQGGCTYMRDSRCPDEVYAGQGPPASLAEVLAAAGDGVGGYVQRKSPAR
ncbi:MAG: tRNA-dihydrouridine synthase [Nitrospinota bacterium]